VKIKEGISKQPLALFMEHFALSLKN